jgi:hypothetical protein
MKTSRHLIAVALAFGLCLLPTAPADESPAKPSRVQWEHLALTHDLRGGQTNAEVARKIIELGKDGWELVSVANFTEGGTTNKTAYYFKRRIE